MNIFFQKEIEEKRSACIPASMMAAIVAKQRRSSNNQNSPACTAATTHTKGSKRVAHLPAAVRKIICCIIEN